MQFLVAPLDKDVTRLSLGHWNSQYAMQFEKNPHLLFRSDKDVLNCRFFLNACFHERRGESIHNDTQLKDLVYVYLRFILHLPYTHKDQFMHKHYLSKL